MTCISSLYPPQKARASPRKSPMRAKMGFVSARSSRSSPPPIPPTMQRAKYQPMLSRLRARGILVSTIAPGDCEDYHNRLVGTRNWEQGTSGAELGARSQELEAHALRERGDYNGAWGV